MTYCMKAKFLPCMHALSLYQLLLCSSSFSPAAALFPSIFLSTHAWEQLRTVETRSREGTLQFAMMVWRPMNERCLSVVALPSEVTRCTVDPSSPHAIAHCHSALNTFAPAIITHLI
jgi:hypothetical protein